MFAKTAAAARFFEIALQPWQVAAGRQVEVQDRVAIARDGLAQVGGDGVDQAALDAGFGQHAFALQRVLDTRRIMPVRDHRLQWRTGVFR